MNGLASSLNDLITPALVFDLKISPIFGNSTQQPKKLPIGPITRLQVFIKTHLEHLID